MPNSPSKTKVQTGFWAEKELLKKVQSILREKGLTLTQEIIKMMENIVEKELQEVKHKNKKT